MFVGHLAVALAAKRVEPRAPLGALVAGTFGLDLIWPALLVAGIERVRIDPGNTAFTPLAFEHYPWSHSLTMAIIWGILAGRLAAFVLKHNRAGLLIGLVVISHWGLDFLTHAPDLPLFPGGPTVGLGLWNSVPATLAVEGVFFAGAVAVYARATRPRSSTGMWALWSLVALTTVIWLSGPFSPPPPNVGAIAAVGFALWLLPIWAAWIDRRRVRV
jgi:hypothetical protein